MVSNSQPHESEADDIQNHIESHIGDESCAILFAMRPTAKN